MGRYASGWSVRLPPGRTVWRVRFQFEGRTVERTTGQTDQGEANRSAAAIYAATISGVSAPANKTVALDDCFSAWLADYELSHTAETSAIVEGYARYFAIAFGSADKMTSRGYAEYMRQRIRQVSRGTLRKELSALRGFVAWMAAERGVTLAPVPGLPKRGHPGARAHNARRRTATVLSEAEVRRLLDALPATSPRAGVNVRAFCEILWETGLRPFSTVAKLEVPLHYSSTAKELFISREIDKARYERKIPVSPRAQAIFWSLCPRGFSGRLFPGINKPAMRASLDAAIKKIGMTVPFSIYDFRHSRISNLANSGAPLAGVAFLVGHKHVSTTALYVHASADAARVALSGPAAQQSAVSDGLVRP
jgi:integrase/recombinase XerC